MSNNSFIVKDVGGDANISVDIQLVNIHGKGYKLETGAKDI
jgi:hypothetical protein